MLTPGLPRRASVPSRSLPPEVCFLLAAYNQDVARSWRRRQEAEQRTRDAITKRQRRKRRLDTYRGDRPRTDDTRPTTAPRGRTKPVVPDTSLSDADPP